MAVEIPVVVDIEGAFQEAAKRVGSAIRPLKQAINDQGVLDLKFRMTVPTAELSRFGNAFKKISEDAAEGTTLIERSFEQLWENGKPKLDDLKSALASFKASLNAKWNNGTDMNSPEVQSLQKAIILMEDYLYNRNRAVSLTEEQYRKSLQAARAEEERNFILQKEAKTISEINERIGALRGKLNNLDPKTKEWRDTAREINKTTAELDKYSRKLEMLNTKSGSINRMSIQMQELTNKWNAMSKAQKFDKDGKLKSSAQKLIDKYKELTKQVEKFGISLEEAANGGGAALDKTNSKIGMLIKNSLRLVALHTGSRFVRNIREVTAEFELQRVALGSIIQDTERAGSLFREIKAAAIESPFEVKDLVSYTKQLSAYQIETDKLFDTTMKLADVSAGLGVDMGRLILAFGQVRAASVLRGQELRQFTEAGIPLVDKLAEKFSELNNRTVTTAEVFELISKRAVPFRMIEEIFDDMTSAGGMFYKMQEKQAETLIGQWSNLKDAASIMYDEIGRTKSVNKAMTTLIKLARNMMTNWREIANVVKVAGTALVTYVGAVKLQAAWVKIATAAEVAATAAETRREAGMRRVITSIIGKEAAEKVATKATIIHTGAMKAADAAGTLFGKTMWRLVAIMAKNPFGLAAIAVASLAGWLVTLSKKTADVEGDVNKAAKSIQQLTRARETDELVKRYEELSKKTNRTAKETAALRDISRELGKAFPQTTKAIDNQTGALILNIEQLKNYSEEAQNTIKDSMRAQITANEGQIARYTKQQEHIQKVLERGYGFVNGSYYFGLSKDAKNAEVLRQKLIAASDGVRELTQANQDLQDSIDGVKRETSDNKEPYPPIDGGEKLKTLRDRISALTDAYKKFLELRKYLSKDEALRNIGLFFPSLGGLEPTFENTVAELESMLNKYNGNADATRIIEQAIANIKFDKIKTDFDDALKRISSDIKRSETARNFYNDILGLTGDNELAASLTMSVYGTEGEEFADRIKRQLVDSLSSLDANTFAGLNDAIRNAFDEGDYDYLMKHLEEVPEKLRDTVKQVASDSEKYNADLIKSFANLVSKYGDTAQKVATIRAKAEVEINNVKRALDLSLKDSKLTPEEKRALRERAAEIIKALEGQRDLDVFKLSDNYVKFFSEISILTAEQAAEVREELRAAYLKAFNDGAIEADKLRRELRAIDEQFRKLSESSSLFGSYLSGGFEGATKKLQEYGDTVSVLAKKMESGKELDATEQNYVNKMLGMFSGQETKNAKNYSELISAFSKSGGLKEAGKALGSMGKWMSAMAAKGAGALAIVDAVFQAVNSTITSIQQMIDELNRMRSEDNKVGGWFKYVSDFNKYTYSGWEKLKSGDIIGAIADAVSSWISIFNNIQEDKVEKINDDIKNQSDLIEDLEYQYGRLEKAIAKSFGSDYITNYNQQLDTLAAKQAAYLEQARLERSKGKSADEEVAKGYENQAREIADQISDMQSQLSEFFSGTDLTSAAKDFANAWIEAYKEFGSVTDAMSEKFNDMIQEMVESSVAAQVMQQLLKPIFDEIDRRAKEGGELSTDDIAAISKLATEQIPAINDAMTTLMNSLQAAGYDFRQQPGQFTGISRNIANATEESITGLAAGINTQNFYMSMINQNVAAILAVISGGAVPTAEGGVSSVQFNNELALQHLSGINDKLSALLNQLDKVIKPTSVSAQYYVSVRQ